MVSPCWLTRVDLERKKLARTAELPCCGEPTVDLKPEVTP